MQVPKKLNLNRFKKSMQGLIDFATLIEQADPSHRAKIIQQAESQDADFIHRVMRKVVYFEELVYIDESIVAEILSQVSPKVLAYALFGCPKEFQEAILKQIGFREKRLYDDELEKTGGSIASSLVLGAQKQVIKVARNLESKGKFVFELSSCPRFKEKKKKATPAATATEAAPAETEAERPALRLVK